MACADKSRDPWWIFTTISLFWNMKKRYELSFREIVRLSPRFAVMLCAMVASICFLVVDIWYIADASVTNILLLISDILQFCDRRFQLKPSRRHQPLLETLFRLQMSYRLSDSG